MKRRGAGSIALALLVATVLTGCTPQIGGLSALTINRDGQLVGLVQMCSGHVTGAALYYGDGSKGPFFKKVDFPRDIDGFYSFSFGDLVKLESQMDAGTTYSLDVGGSRAAEDVEFTKSQLAGLTPNIVLAGDLHAHGNVLQYKFMSPSEFRKEACSVNWH